jgi:hypothetical protein
VERVTLHNRDHSLTCPHAGRATAMLANFVATTTLGLHDLHRRMAADTLTVI